MEIPMRERTLFVIAALMVAVLFGALGARAPQPAPRSVRGDSRFLYAWAGDADKRDSDFLAVIDADPRSPTYATVVRTLPAGAIGTRPHHTNHEMPADGMLWANGFDSGQTFRFDLRDPASLRLIGTFAAPAPFSHPHSYVRLANGHVLATFQHRIDRGQGETGGLVEFDRDGRVLRSAHAAAPAIDPGVRPYSLAVVPALDRIVTTATDMHQETRSTAVQVWRLSDLALIKTILLPPGSRGNENAMTAEPRVLEDGRTVLVNTFRCGLYRLTDLAGDAPSAEWVYSTPWQAPPYCALPVVMGRFWIQTSGPEHAVISLDVSDSRHPKEVGRLTLQPRQIPHWIAAEPNGDRLVITGYELLESRLLVARVDRATGALRLDTEFKPRGAEQPGVDFSREQWPHGATGRAIPHGAVFSRGTTPRQN
jgi:hypothetical protein